MHVENIVHWPPFLEGFFSTGVHGPGILMCVHACGCTFLITSSYVSFIRIANCDDTRLVFRIYSSKLKKAQFSNNRISFIITSHNHGELTLYYLACLCFQLLWRILFLAGWNQAKSLRHSCVFFLGSLQHSRPEHSTVVRCKRNSRGP